MFVALALLAAQPGAAPSAPPADHLAPPAIQQDRGPDLTQGIAMAESAVRATLRDPDSARFTWASGFVAGSYKPLLGRRSNGWVICGTVNAKNGYGGYTGQYAVIAVVSGGSVITTDMDQPGRWSAHAGWVADQCRKNGLPVL